MAIERTSRDVSVVLGPLEATAPGVSCGAEPQSRAVGHGTGRASGIERLNLLQALSFLSPGLKSVRLDATTRSTSVQRPRRERGSSVEALEGSKRQQNPPPIL